MTGSEAYVECFAQGDDELGIALGPGAEHVGLVIGQGADEGDGFHVGAEREQFTDAFHGIVLEQHQGLAGHLAGEGAAIRRGLIGRAGLGVGMVEEA